jgi:hypothetical protein
MTAYQGSSSIDVEKPTNPDEPGGLQNRAGASVAATVSGNAALIASPQSLSGVFDQAFDLYKRHFKTLVLISALLYFPTQILLHGIYNTWLLPLFAHIQTPTGNGDPISWIIFIFGVLMIGIPEYGIPGLSQICLLALMSGPLCVAVSDVYFGRTPTIRESYRRSRRSIPRLLVGWMFAALISIGMGIASVFASIIIVMIISVLITLTGVPPTVSSGISGVLLIVGGIVSFLICTSIVARFFLFTAPLVVLEGLPLSAVWNRNQQMVARIRFRHTWGAATMLPFIVFGLQYLILFSSYSALGALQLSPQFEFMAAATFTALIILFFQPYVTIFITMLYYDYRVRGEGFDLVLLAAFGFESEPTDQRRKGPAIRSQDRQSAMMESSSE